MNGMTVAGRSHPCAKPQAATALLKGPREMMLICLDDDHRTARFVAAFPDGTPLSLYEGFVEIQPDQLPKTAALLVGHQDSFEELFSFPHTHRRR
jgi:hypothetical protein